jgi:hypothetical protein
MALRRRQYRHRPVTRLMALALAAAVALLFTPCCELSAAIGAGAAASAVIQPVPDRHAPTQGHAPASDTWCVTALDESAGPLTDLAPPGANGSAAPGYVAHSGSPPPTSPRVLHRPVQQWSATGPPLYLRFAHLLM